ncbi:hypothetical protein [Sphingobacterium deserti]|uniref:Lipoprotein n=1 Tax=Sphingobacterium deserti TaxID=1229276 RepID=A0A0B8TAS9_9SPHI|nr:hypothetical protein [Sphingobacterium deserti]KGE15979.1 hypothetical protein DI53_0094 [Sphingobacterium deserti]
MKYWIITCLLISFFAVSCSDEDTDPSGRITDISRLYVSFEEYQTNTDGVPDTNIRIVRKADSSVFELDSAHLSMARGGGVILFNPFLKSIIQASHNNEVQRDSSIYVTTVQERGQLVNGGMMASPWLKKVRGLAYHRASDALFVVNADGERSGIFVIDRPNSISQNRRPWKQFFTGDLNMWGSAYRANTLYVGKQGDAPGIYVFENIVNRQVNTADSTASLAPTRVLTIEGARNLYGMTYDTVKNILAIAEHGDGTTLGTGRILLFDNFSGMASGSSISPSRIITGVASQLTQPVDVAIDARSSGQFIYVADRKNKILRFRLTDNGDVTPDRIFDTTDYGTPVGLALDSRDDSTLPQF